MPKLIIERYEEGLRAYREGRTPMFLYGVCEGIETHARTATSDPGPQFSHDAVPSLIMGFAEGLIEDIRRVAGSPNVTRRGLTA